MSRSEAIMRARIISGMLGLWLFLSMFFWPHTNAQVLNSWFVSAAVMFFAGLAVAGIRWARYASVVLGAWLIAAGIAALTTTSSRLTPIHNLVMGALLSFFGLMRDVGHWYADSELEPGPNTIGFEPADEVTVRASPNRR
jgi:hypothetical protein